ncbi:MAG TPA: VOC family protein [Pyrinomonadaceae bacterium]|nr:VOC family protein [Pyrinomonadaceae bacterium]
MGIGIVTLDHVNVTVPAEHEEATKQFYASVVGLPEIPKPAGSRQNMGAWYQLGDVQLHLSVEEVQQTSDRHIGYEVVDIGKAEQQFSSAGIEIIPDKRPQAGRSRFYVRDPGGNLLEITQRTE